MKKDAAEGRVKLSSIPRNLNHYVREREIDEPYHVLLGSRQWAGCAGQRNERKMWAPRRRCSNVPSAELVHRDARPRFAAGGAGDRRMIGREVGAAKAAVDDELLLEAEGLIAAAMRADNAPGAGASSKGRTLTIRKAFMPAGPAPLRCPRPSTSHCQPVQAEGSLLDHQYAAALLALS